MSANAQTNSSTGAGPEPPAVGKNNAGNGAIAIANNPNGKSAKNGNNNNNGNNGKEKPESKGQGKSGNNNNNTNGNNGKGKGKTGNNTNGEENPENNAEAKEANGKNPLLDKISASIANLTSSIESSDCPSIVSKAKTVIENANPVLEAIEKQELRENNSQLANVKGSVRNATNSIRKKCPKGPNGKANTRQNNTGTSQNNTGGIPVKPKQEAPQEPPKVGQLWNVNTTWGTQNVLTGYDAIVKIVAVTDKDVTIQAVSVRQSALTNGIKKDQERTYSMEEWKALRKVLEEDAKANVNNKQTNNANGAPQNKENVTAQVGQKWKLYDIEGTGNGRRPVNEIQIEITEVTEKEIKGKVLESAKKDVKVGDIVTYDANAWTSEGVGGLFSFKGKQLIQGGGKRRRKTRKLKRKSRKARKSRRRRQP
jgi:hypothetical protein